MSNVSMPNQASETSREVGASQQAQLFAPPNTGESAVLDANIAAGTSTNPQGEAIAHPIPSNFSSATEQVRPKLLDLQPLQALIRQMGSRRKKVSLIFTTIQTPASDAQGMLPDTDAIKLPIDSEVNHQE